MSKSNNLLHIKQHPLIKTLINLEGNPKTLTLIEPLWGIPNNLIAPFVTVYMYALGVGDVQIGTILSLGMIVQVLFSFGGGIITDKLGRKTTTILGDFFGWVIPCLIWAISRNFWFFLAAVLLNGFEQVNQTAWTCLLIEDAKKKEILNIYTWITIAGLMAVFAAPLSGTLIKHTSVVPVMRILYLIYALTMLAKCIITYLYTKETRNGKIRKAETKKQSFSQIISEYKYILPKIFKDTSTVKILIIMVVLCITAQISNSFFALYVTNNLGIPDQYLAFFPIVRAIIMLVFMFTIQVKLERLPIKIPMSAGFLIYIIGQLVLVFISSGSVTSIIAYTLLEAFAFALVVPRKDSMLALYINAEERARIVSVLAVVMFTFSSPFGYIAGRLSSLDRRLPFYFNAVLYFIGLIVIISYKEPIPSQYDEYDDID